MELESKVNKMKEEIEYLNDLQKGQTQTLNVLHHEIEVKEVEIAQQKDEILSSPIKYNSLPSLPECLLNIDKYKSQNNELEMQFKSTSYELTKQIEGLKEEITMQKLEMASIQQIRDQEAAQSELENTRLKTAFEDLYTKYVDQFQHIEEQQDQLNHYVNCYNDLNNKLKECTKEYKQDESEEILRLKAEITTL